MSSYSKNLLIFSYSFLLMFFLFGCTKKENNSSDWEPLVDWGHWRLGQKSDMKFLQQNNMTITFGSGAPNFEEVTREEFDQKIAEAKTFNENYHANGYIMLRYLSTSLNGETATNKDQPEKEQIRMLDFYNEQWKYFEDIIGSKPQENPTTWIMVHPDGSFPYYRYAPYGRETTGRFEAWGCPDNPYYVRMMEGKIQAQASTGIDGSYVDWTHIAGGTCYCDFTRQNFIHYLDRYLPAEIAKLKYGNSNYKSIKLPEKRGDDFWMEWITFRCWTVAEFHKKLRIAARKVNPYFMISGNVFGGFGYGPIAYDAAGNIEMLAKEDCDDFIYSEIQEFLDCAPRKNEEGTKITNSPALKFLTAASHNKPVIIYATEITPPIFPDPTEKCLNAMAQINIAEAIANHTIFREKRETPPGATAMYHFLATQEDYLLDAKLKGNVAILASLNQYLADELSFAFSMSRVLSDKGINHVMILEDDLHTEYLDRYDVIIIPYLPLLKVEKQNILKQYAQEGGLLLILGESGVKNEFNLPNQDVILAQVLGGNKYPEEYVEKRVGHGKIAFIPLPVPGHKYLIPAKIKSEFTTFGPSMGDVFADIPEAYTRNRIHPELRQILNQTAEKVLHLLPNRLTIVKSKSPYVEITTMLPENEDHLLVHLVNYDVTIDGIITPVKQLGVQVLLPEKKRLTEVLYSGNLKDPMPLQNDHININGRLVTLKLGELEVYGLAILKLE